MNRQTFLARLGLGFLGTLFARSASATTEPLPGAPDTADAVPAEPVGWPRSYVTEAECAEYATSRVNSVAIQYSPDAHVVVSDENSIAEHGLLPVYIDAEWDPQIMNEATARALAENILQDLA